MQEDLESAYREDLFKLLDHYAGEINHTLGFCYHYLNFYVGLFSAILAATLSGLIAFDRDGKTSDLLASILLLGPIMIVILGCIGYLTFRVFYRRFVEAKLTFLNIQTMLSLRNDSFYAVGNQEPLFKSANTRGFIVEFEREKIREILDLAEQKNWSSEKVLKLTLKKGDTLLYALLTLGSFQIVAAVLIIFIAFYY